jgi:hypothetical protein
MTNDMNDKPQIKLSETVVLIDAAFLNFVITDMKRYFEDFATFFARDRSFDVDYLSDFGCRDCGRKK